MGRESSPGLKEFFNLPFLVLKARHPAPQCTCVLLNKLAYAFDFLEKKKKGGGGGGGA